jgi:chemotaxis receptor (MCP) glutamine deamidase CheD
MIVGDLKPLEEIVSAIKEYKQILVLGCGSCVTVCLSGGEKEAEQLCHELSKIKHYEGPPPKLERMHMIRFR